MKGNAVVRGGQVYPPKQQVSNFGEGLLLRSCPRKNGLAAFQDVGHGLGQGSEIFDVFSGNDKKTKYASELGNASRRHKGAKGVQVLISEASAMLVDGKTEKLGLRTPNTGFVGVQSNANTGTNTQEFLPAVAEIMLIVRVSEPIVDVV
jgi:hypothetical protein